MRNSESTRAAARSAARARRRPRWFGVGVSALLVVVAVFAAGSPASATSYPSWADVVAARANATAAQAEVTRITALIASLTSQLQAAQADADAKGAAAFAAQQSYFDAESKQQALEAQVEAATAKAAESKKRIGQYASRLARGTGDSNETTLYLMTHGDSASAILNGLSNLGQLTAAQNGIMQLAIADQNSAKQLKTVATAQAGILKVRKQAADDAEAAAAAAAAKLQAVLDDQTQHQQELQLQLAALTTQLAMTETQYRAGVAAAAAAAAAAAKARGAGTAGVVSAQGWALPTIGRITSPWGFRADPAAGYSWRMHYGDDIAAGCLVPIYAAHSGTVAYAGTFGNIGNYILIDNGDQYSTSYGHIANGQTFVHIGDHVSAGQNIARTGSTGASTGCHLYFQVYVNGTPVDPVPFMSARGIRIG